MLSGRATCFCSRQTEDERAEVRVQRFLCGHDERAWFVVGVPGMLPALLQPRKALKPPVCAPGKTAARSAFHERQRRKTRLTSAGEWFFLPRQIENDKGRLCARYPIVVAKVSPFVASFSYKHGRR